MSVFFYNITRPSVLQDKVDFTSGKEIPEDAEMLCFLPYRKPFDSFCIHDITRFAIMQASGTINIVIYVWYTEVGSNRELTEK